MTCFDAARARGAFLAIASASSRATSSARPGAATRLTKWSSAASAAGSIRPVSTSSMAKEYGTRCCSRNNPPPFAVSPRLTSGRPNVALSAATIRSQASAISNPPPRANPSTAAMTGLTGGRATIPAKPRPGTVGISPRANPLRSMPAQNVPPAPVMTQTLNDGVASNQSSAPASACASCSVIAFFA